MKAKSDCEAVYDATKPDPDKSALVIKVKSTVGALFGHAIEEAARKTAAEFGVATGTLAIDDDGALDFVIAARVEATLRAAGFSLLSNSALADKQRSGQPGVAELKDDEDLANVQLLEAAKTKRRYSRMYIPGNQPDLLPNAGLFGADALVLDLEDSVPPLRKAEARILIRRALETHRDFFRGAEIIVRINPLSGSFGKDDIEELAGCLPDAILLPKCEHPEEITVLATILKRLEGSSTGPQHKNKLTLIMPLIETAKGVLAASAIAQASPRVAALCFGAEDFTRDIRAQRTAAGSETLFARQAIVIAARAAGVQVHDSVYSNVDDTEGLAAYCTASRAMGFDGVGLLHPRQISVAHAAFAPDAAEIEEAKRTVSVLEEAEAQGLGVAALDGRMIDAPVAERARRIVAMAKDNCSPGKEA